MNRFSSIMCAQVTRRLRLPTYNHKIKSCGQVVGAFPDTSASGERRTLNWPLNGSEVPSHSSAAQVVVMKFELPLPVVVN